MRRDLWRTSHFLADAQARRAIGHLESLGDAAVGESFSVADELAASSVAAAQSMVGNAGVVWATHGREGFRSWVEPGRRLAAEEAGCREAAQAYFALAPECWGEAGLRGVRTWGELGLDLASVSRKLATTFLTTTAQVLRCADAEDRLREWVNVGLRTYREHGWRGEFLAHSYFSAAPRAPCALSPRVYSLWAGAGVALTPGLKQRDMLSELPDALGAWSEEAQRLFFRAAIAIASVDNRAGRTFYGALPGALEGVEAPLREMLLRCFVNAARRTPALVAELASTAGGLLRQIPETQREAALGLAQRVAERFPPATIHLLRALPRAYEEGDAGRIPEWVEAGIGLAKSNRDAGIAFFAMESRTSTRVLHADSMAVSLEEAQGLLRKYIQMLSGLPASLRGFDRFRLLLPIEEFPDELEVALPFRVDVLGTHEDNLRTYRFLAALLAGRRELGTYDFTPPDGAIDAADPPGHALWKYIDRAEQPEFLEELFLLAEGFRIYHEMSRSYRGLAREGRWVGRCLLEKWSHAGSVPADRMLDVILAALLAGESGDASGAVPASTVAFVARLLLPLEVPGVSVQDSMRIAEELARALSTPDRERTPLDDALDGIRYEKATGDSMVDPWFALEEDDLPFEAKAAPLEREPAAAEDRPAQEIELELGEEAEDSSPPGAPMSPEELQRLLDSGVRLDIKQSHGGEMEGLGLYVSDLLGKVPDEQIESLREIVGDPETRSRRPTRRWTEASERGPSFYYDEWDYHIGDYRSRWCRLHELAVDPDSGEFFNQTLGEYASLIPDVRRQFQKIRPEMYRVVRGLEDGEDFDLNAAIEARVEMRARRAPTSKLYVARQREERDVATLFLIDMSASTDEPLEAGNGARPGRSRRVIDVTKEALVMMATALDEIGDAYAIYGFSGHGRDNVEFYRVKTFREALTTAVKGRLGGIQPRRSTRMGTALRHALEKMAATTARSKHLILLSDGFPQDHDYGQDRRSNVYGIRDTAVAMREMEAAGVTPFCITVDKAGHDYLREMCEESRYMVIENIAELPRELPKIYHRVVRGG